MTAPQRRRRVRTRPVEDEHSDSAVADAVVQAAEVTDPAVVDLVVTSVEVGDPAVVDLVMESVGRGDPAVADRVVAGLDVGDPPMLAVAGHGRGWWPIGTAAGGVTVRRHGETLTVPWSSVTLDAA